MLATKSKETMYSYVWPLIPNAIRLKQFKNESERI